MNDRQKALEIIRQLADDNYYYPEDIIGKRRFKTLVKVRHIAMKTIREETDMSLAEIAQIFDVDHTSVMYAVNEKYRHEKNLKKALRDNHILYNK